MKSIATTLTAALAIASLAACNLTPASNTMSKDDARNLKTIAPLAMNGLVNSIRQGGSSAVATSAVRDASSLAALFDSPLAAQVQSASRLTPQATTGTCGPSTAPTDADGDKVPADFSYTYDCKVVFSNAFTFEAKGVARSLDSNDNDATSGYTTNGEIRYNFIFTNTDNGQSSSFSFVVRWNATATFGQDGGYNISTDQRVIFQPETDRSEFSYTLNANYLPDNDGNTQRFDAGIVNFDGQVAYTNARGGLSRFKLVSSDLHFGGACPRGVDRGTVRAEDEANLVSTKNNVFELTATACDTWTAKYNGETLF
jgi:hypothetical protein